jgi:hypothetical protein
MSVKYCRLKIIVRTDVQRGDVMNCDPDVSVITDLYTVPSYSKFRAFFLIDTYS